MSSSVGTDLIQRTAKMDAAIKVDDIVIADVNPPIFEVHFAYLFYGHVAPFWGCRAV